MSKCERCGFDYKSIEKNFGCTHKHGYFKDGAFHEPIKVGDPGDFCEGEDQNARCHDCGAPMGAYHHANCDAERCPICGGQLWTCDCFNNEGEELALAAIYAMRDHLLKGQTIDRYTFMNILKKFNLIEGEIF